MAKTEDSPEVDPGVGLEVAPKVDPEDVPEDPKSLNLAIL